MDSQNETPQNPNIAQGNGQGFAGDMIDSPSVSYENYSDTTVNAVNEAKQANANADNGIPINVINAVNANGIVSGRKMVDELWQKLAICAFVIAGGFLIGMVIAVIFTFSLNGTIAEMKNKNTQTDGKLSDIYAVLGTSDQSSTMDSLQKTDTLNGGDLKLVNDLLVKKYGASYQVDFDDTNIAFVREKSGYKFVSLGIKQADGTVRAILYGKIADGSWKLSSFNSVATGTDAAKADNCKDSSDDEKVVLKLIDLCTETE